jgi:hypothetical protein
MQSMVRPKKPIVMTSKQNLAIGNQGRPTLYSDELGTRICELLAAGHTLSSVCKDHPDLPSERTIRRWALDPEHPFSPQYARARGRIPQTGRRDAGYRRCAGNRSGSGGARSPAGRYPQMAALQGAAQDLWRQVSVRRRPRRSANCHANSDRTRDRRFFRQRH